MQDEVAAKEYSEKLGYQTLKQAKTSRTTATGQGGGSRNRSVEEYERALMLPQEIMEMPYDYQLLFISPTRKTEPLKVKSRKVFCTKNAISRSVVISRRRKYVTLTLLICHP
ncbi:hypothetical protein BC497_29610 (plasmid) [Klebsiella variicola]|nr:hypothetical protein BC497_29610 [Klebsiella variicola]